MKPQGYDRFGALEGSPNGTSAITGRLPQDNQFFDSRFGANHLNNTFDSPKKRNKSFNDPRNSEPRQSLMGGYDQSANYLKSPQFGIQRSSRSTNNEPRY